VTLDDTREPEIRPAASATGGRCGAERSEGCLAIIDRLDCRVEDGSGLAGTHRRRFLDQLVEILLVPEDQSRPEPAVRGAGGHGSRALLVYRLGRQPTPFLSASTTPDT
jgi:hypothetical protein